jgi:hypothetical protein
VKNGCHRPIPLYGDVAVLTALIAPAPMNAAGGT